MDSIAIFLIYAIFFIAFFGNLFVDYNILPPEITLLTEISIYLLFVLSFIISSRSGKKYKLDLYVPFGFLALIGLCSAAINNKPLLDLIVSARLVFRFYLFYLALINLNLSAQDIKKITKILFVIFLLQLPACAIRFSFYGISELTIGTYASHGGGLTPIIPIVAIGYLSGFFVFYKKKYYFLLLALAFVCFGIVGEKRVLFLVYPIMFIIIFSLLWLEKKGLGFGLMCGWITILCLSLAVSAIMLSAIKTLNPQHKTWGRIDFGYALDYAKRYTTTRHGRVGGGRIATTQIAFEYLFDGNIGNILLGYGPGSLTWSIVKDSKYLDKRILGLAKSYGLNGMSYVAVEYGILGLLCISSVIIVFIVRSRRWFKREKDPYWKALSFGTYVFAFYIAGVFFVYNKLPFIDDTITPVIYYAMAITFVRDSTLCKGAVL